MGVWSGFGGNLLGWEEPEKWEFSGSLGGVLSGVSGAIGATEWELYRFLHAKVGNEWCTAEKKTCGHDGSVTCSSL